MAFVLVIIGLLMVITGARGTYAQFGSQVASEFTAQPGGGPSFTTWLLAIAAVGAIGYIPTLQIISRWLMALVIIVIVLANKGFFAKLQQSVNQSPVPPSYVPQGATQPTAENPSGAPQINLGLLGKLNTNPIAPGSIFDRFLNLFGIGSGQPFSSMGGNVPAQ